MKLSLVTVKALEYTYIKNKGIDYTKYNSIKLTTEPVLSYMYVLENAGNILISSLIFDWLRKNDYVESTKCENGIIKVVLNLKYFYALQNKQEI